MYISVSYRILIQYYLRQTESGLLGVLPSSLVPPSLGVVEETVSEIRLKEEVRVSRPDMTLFAGLFCRNTIRTQTLTSTVGPSE